MTPFTQRAGVLHGEDVSLETIAAGAGTPCYVYSAGAIADAYGAFTRAVGGATGREPLVCYAVKANGNLAVLRTLARAGAGADVVSGGELRRALAAGIPPQRIIFSGVGKTRDEIALALETGIHQLNVESDGELDLIAAVADERAVRAPVAVRINPDVDAGTHDKISTGRAGDKFGVDLPDVGALLDRAASFPRVDVVGLAVHIGSHIYALDAFRAAFTRLAELYRDLRARGWPLRRLDLGGGLGIAYDDTTPAPDPAAYGRVVAESVGQLDAELAFEPGRFFTANAGVLLTRVLYVKRGRVRPFVVVDAGMNDFIRPALYDAYHAISPVRPQSGDPQPCDVVGPVCETADTFARARPLPPVAAGDHLVLHSTGAYGAVMASMYNARPPAAEVMVDGARWAVVQHPPTHDEIMARQPLPAWLADAPEPADTS